MLNSRGKFSPGLALILLCGLNPPQAAAQQKEQHAKATKVAEAPEVATRFSDMVPTKNAKGTAVPLKVEVKNWTLTRSARAFEMPDQGFSLLP